MPRLIVIALSGVTIVLASGLLGRAGASIRDARHEMPLLVLSRFTGTPQSGPLIGPTRSRMYAITSDGSGGWWIGGDFHSIDGARCSGLAHLLPDGAPHACPRLLSNRGWTSVGALYRSGSTLYVGGSFTSIDGMRRSNLAALDSNDGHVFSWNPAADDEVQSLTEFRGTVYAAGYFTRIGGKARFSLGAVDAQSGLATRWDPEPNANQHDDSASKVAVIGDLIYVGGAFSRVGGRSCAGLAALDPDTGRSAKGCPTRGFPVAMNDSTYFDASADQIYERDARTGARIRGWHDPIHKDGKEVWATYGDAVYVSFDQRSLLSNPSSPVVLAALDSHTGARRAWSPPPIPACPPTVGLCWRISAIAVDSRSVLVGFRSD